MRQVTSLKNSIFFVARHRCAVERHKCFNQLINYLLTGYPVRTENSKPSVTWHGPHSVRSVLCDFGLKATFHLTISMRGERGTGKIQRNNYYHGSCGPSLTCKTSSVSLIFTHGTHRNVKNR